MFNSGITYQNTVTMVTEICCNCGVAFGLPSDLQSVLRADPNKYFYCPNGHSQHYSESTESKLRKQIEAEKQRTQRKDMEIIQLQGQVQKVSRKLRRTEKRISNGVCPCCNRTFKDLAAHMTTKHPDFKKVVH